MRPAAGKARECAVHAADSWKLLTTIRAAIEEPRGASSCRKRQVVTALLVSDSQVATRGAPLVSMRQNYATASAKLGKKMGQFVAERSIDFVRMLEQTRV